MGQQTVTSAELAVKKIDQVRADYKKRVQEAASDQFMRERVSEWVMDSCERVAKENKEQAQALLENALKNRQTANKNSASLYNPRS